MFANRDKIADYSTNLTTDPDTANENYGTSCTELFTKVDYFGLHDFLSINRDKYDAFYDLIQLLLSPILFQNTIPN